jgi:Uma2 family endonuclease
MDRFTVSPNTLNERQATMVSTPLITAEELFSMPSNSWTRELVKGELRTMPPAGSEHGYTVVNITGLFFNYFKANPIGLAFGAETRIKIASTPDTVRAPDLSFIRNERIPESGIPNGYWLGAPDLAVEIISPGDSYSEVEEKSLDWLDAGTQRVIVVNPRNRTVTVYRSPSDATVFRGSDELDGGDVMPGFTCKVSEILG